MTGDVRDRSWYNFFFKKGALIHPLDMGDLGPCQFTTSNHFLTLHVVLNSFLSMLKALNTELPTLGRLQG